MSRVPEDLVSVPSSPSPLSPPRAPHQHEGSITPQAPAPECPICLEGPSTPPNALDAFFPCCAAFAHLGCIQQRAHRHGHCPNCRQNIAYLRHDPAFVARCEDAGVRMTPLAADGAETVYAAVSDYAFTSALAVALAWPVQPWVLWSSQTGACVGRRCLTVGTPASTHGPRPGSACVAKRSCPQQASPCHYLALHATAVTPS